MLGEGLSPRGRPGSSPAQHPTALSQGRRAGLQARAGPGGWCLGWKGLGRREAGAGPWGPGLNAIWAGEGRSGPGPHLSGDTRSGMSVGLRLGRSRFWELKGPPHVCTGTQWAPCLPRAPQRRPWGQRLDRAPRFRCMAHLGGP